MSYTTDQTAKKIMAAYDELKPTYDSLAASSWSDYVNNLAVGAGIPAKGRLCTKESQDKFTAFVKAQGAKALEAVEAYRTDIEKAMAAAPTDEALRAVQAFALRDPSNSTPEDYAGDIDRLMARYGENYSVYMALHDLAVKAGIKDFRKHKLYNTSVKMKDLTKAVNDAFDPITLANDGFSPARRSIFEMVVNECLSDDPPKDALAMFKDAIEWKNSFSF